MTTSITVSTNGSYVSEGKITYTPLSGDDAPITEDVKVGPGSNVTKTWGYRHNTTTSISLIERAATIDEIEAAKPKTA